MTANYFEKRPDEISRFSVSTTAEVTVHITEREGHQFIVIKQQHPAADESAAESEVKIPVALLPELKRAIAALEENFGDDGEIDDSSKNDSPGDSRRPHISFAHHSEEQFARILDFYHIEWQYEPRTFAIEWDDEGNVTSSFTPDFYLSAHDLYIELTTLKQGLVTKKNRKVRLLRELYPEIKIKMLYASDYRKLVEKFAASGTWQEAEREK